MTSSFKEIPLSHALIQGCDNQNNYQNDFRAERIIQSFDAMEEKIHRIGKIHRILGWIKKERGSVTDFWSSSSHSAMVSVWAMLKNMYQTGWPGRKLPSS